MKFEDAVRRAKWQLNHYRGQGIVPIDNKTLYTLLAGLEAERALKTCGGCTENGLWDNEFENGYFCPCSYCIRQAVDKYRCGPEPKPPDNYIGEEPIAYGAPFDEPKEG